MVGNSSTSIAAIGPYTMRDEDHQDQQQPDDRRNLRTEDVERVRDLHEAGIACLWIARAATAAATAGLPRFASV